LVTEVRIAENARTAAAAQIVARRLGDTEVSVDGAALPDDTAEEFAVVKDMRVHIDSVVDITVRPGQSSAELDRAVESAQAGLDAELERLGVESLDQARHRAEERASAEAVLAEANSTLRVLSGSDDRAGLDTALSRAEHLAGESADSSEPGNESAGIDELETAVETTAAAVDAAQEAGDTERETPERPRTEPDAGSVSSERAATAHARATTRAN